MALHLSELGKKLFEDKLTEKAWTLERLADKSQIGIATIKKFSSRKGIRRTNFVEICRLLDLDWDKVVEQDSQVKIESFTQKTDNILSTDHFKIDETQDFSLAQYEKINSFCQNKIMDQYSHMTLLNGYKVSVAQLYVDVYLLDKPESEYQNSPESLLEKEHYDISTDRLALGKRRRRNSGFEIAKQKSKLVILGKPGSGKTTFLKHLAIDWCNKKIHKDKLLIFFEFRQIRDSKWNLLDQIAQELELGVEEVKDLSQKGNFAIFMDGLDEISTDQLRSEVRNQIRQFTKEYPNNSIILSCRTQVIENFPAGFTAVEVADFNPDQVKSFVLNWFQSIDQSQEESEKKWQIINQTIETQADFRELTKTPILLNLICLVLSDEGNIPNDKFRLYKKGIKLLLQKWNQDKDINDWQIGTDIYKKLSCEEKENLLIEIAANKFENPSNFILFEEKEIACVIQKNLHLHNMTEGVAVLKAIEANHGLLIERADGLWSFSHLTFQEHFTSEWLMKLKPSQLEQKIANPRWNKIILQVVKSQQPSDRLIRLIKRAIDRSVSNDRKIQKILIHIFKKQASLSVAYLPIAMRAFYLELEQIHLAINPLDANLENDVDLFDDEISIESEDLDDEYSDYLQTTQSLEILENYFDIDESQSILDEKISHFPSFKFARVCDSKLNFALDKLEFNQVDDYINLDYVLMISLKFASNIERSTLHDFIVSITQAHTLAQKIKFEKFSHLGMSQELKIIVEDLSIFQSSGWKQFILFWYKKGDDFVNKIRDISIRYRDIGHDWQLSQKQKEKLQYYYRGNVFLWDLINIDGSVTKTTESEIQKTMLLPWKKLKKMYQM